MSTWTLTPAEYTATVSKIDKINERAAKKGFTGRIDVVAEKGTREVEVAPGVHTTEVVYRVRLDGTAPCYGGWEFLATLTWDAEAGLITRVSPGVDEDVVIDRSALVEGHCDHCGQQRRRTATYLVRNTETGEQKQVGSTCMKDFLGWTGRVTFLSMDEVEREVSESLGGYSERRWTTDTVLSVAWAAIKTYGWVPASSDPYGWSTKEVVSAVLDPRNAQEREMATKVFSNLTGYVEERAEQVRSFILSDEFSGNSEYVTNLKAVIAAETVSARNLGLVVSAPQAMFRAQEKSLVEKAPEIPESEYFGQVGEKVEFTGTITTVRFIEGNYGVTTLYIIRNMTTGQQIKWFSSNGALGDREGVEVTLKGTVKGHEEWNGIKSTVLTRCKKIG